MGNMQPIARRRGRPTKAQGKEIADRILESGYGIMVRLGYNAVSMEAIAEAAAVTKRTLYHHYPSKALLFEAAFRRRLGEWSQGAMSLPGPGPLDARVRHFSQSVVIQMQSPEIVTIIRLALSESSLSSVVGKTFTDLAFGLGNMQLIRLMKESSDAEKYDLSQVEAMVDIYFDMFWGFFSRKVIAGGPPSEKEHSTHAEQQAEALIKLVSHVP